MKFERFMEEIREQNSTVEKDYNGDVLYSYNGSIAFRITEEDLEELNQGIENVSWETVETSELFTEKAKKTFIKYSDLEGETIALGDIWDGNEEAEDSILNGSYTDKHGITYEFEFEKIDNEHLFNSLVKIVNIF